MTVATSKRKRPPSERPPINNRILRLEAAREKLGLRATMFDEKRKNDARFPKAIPLGVRAIGFYECELEEYIAALLKERV